MQIYKLEAEVLQATPRLSVMFSDLTKAHKSEKIYSDFEDT
jgi:hypothetical protein